MQRALEQQAAQRASLSESLEYRVDEARKQALDMLNEQRSECEALYAEVRMCVCTSTTWFLRPDS